MSRAKDVTALVVTHIKLRSNTSNCQLRGDIHAAAASSAPSSPLIPAGHQPSKLVKMMPLHQMPAADPEPERLDETQVKTIQTKINNKLDPAMPVRMRTCRVAQSLRPSRAA